MLALVVPLAATLAGIDPEGTSEENREAAPPPAVPHDYTSLAAWPEGLTKYLADHLAFRSSLVRWQARFRVGVLGASPTPDVILGRDGWLFYGTDGAVEDYSGSHPFSAAELEVWRTTLQHTQDWLEGQGIAYLFVIAPDKHAIYPELMPDGIRRVSARPRARQLVDYLRTHSTVRVIDLTEAVAAARPAGRLYHRTDTHWNDLGAFVGYQQVMQRLPASLGLHPRAREEFDLQAVARPGMDLARMLGMRSVLDEEDLHLDPRAPRSTRVVEPAQASRGMMYARVVTEGAPAQPRAVVFRDSFGSAMIPFLSDHFSRAVYAWQNEIDPALITAERPQVVIQQWVARHFYTASPYDAVAAMAEIGQQ